MSKKEISRINYLIMVWTVLFLGIVGNVIFSTIGIFYGFDYYTAAYMAVSTLVIGFGVGLACARAREIQDIDN